MTHQNTLERNIRTRLLGLYFSASLYVGMAIAVLGPSLLDLIDQTGSSLEGLSLLFPARAASYLFGSWIAGSLFDRLKGHHLIAGGVVVMGLTLVLVPSQSDTLPVILLVMAMASAAGLVDVGCNTLLFRVEEIKLGLAMNGLHLFYGLGSFFAPLILISSLAGNKGIQYGYWGLGLFSILILLQLINLPEPKNYQELKNKPSSQQLDPGRDRSILILIISVFFFAFVGVEIGFGDWLSTYSVQSGLTDQKTAILLTSLYWGSFTAGRLFGIPLAAKIAPDRILSYNMVGGVIAMGLMVFFPQQVIFLWIGSILLGFALASTFPTMLTISESLLPMTGKLTSRFFISGSLGSIFLPWIIGRYIDQTGPFLIIQILSIAMILALVAYWILARISKKTRH